MEIREVGGDFLPALARNKLVRGCMDTMMWEILAGTLIFAAANIVYFEIRRLIKFLRNYSKSKPPQK
jgi:hypothetical protein